MVALCHTLCAWVSSGGHRRPGILKVSIFIAAIRAGLNTMDVFVNELLECGSNRGEFELIVPRGPKGQHGTSFVCFFSTATGGLDFRRVSSMRTGKGWQAYVKKMNAHDVRWLRLGCYAKCWNETVTRMFSFSSTLHGLGGRWLRRRVCSGRIADDSTWRSVA